MMRFFSIFVMLIVLLLAMPALAQDATPTAEGESVVVAPVDDVADGVDSPGTLQSVMDFIIEGDLIQWGLMFVMVFFLGNSVPQSKVDAGILRASETATPIDDVLWKILDAINGNQTGAPETPKPAPPDAEDPEPDPETPVNDEPDGEAPDGDDPPGK